MLQLAPGTRPAVFDHILPISSLDDTQGLRFVQEIKIIYFEYSIVETSIESILKWEYVIFKT